MEKYLKNPAPIDKQLKGITHAMGFVSFGSGLISIFIPLLLINAGMSLTGVASFYLIYSITKISINYQLLKFTNKYGPSLSLAFSFVANALQLIGLMIFQSTNSTPIFIISAMMLGLANSLSWNAQHLFISRNINPKTKSRNVASIDIFLSSISIMAPLIGALLTAYMGKNFIYIFASLMFILALIPLRSMRHYQNKPIKQKIRFHFSGASKKDILANLSLNIETSISGQMWPVFLAVAIGSYKKIGLIAAFGALAMFVVTKIAGKLGDKGYNSKIIWQGSFLISFVDFLRIFASTTTLITFINAAYQSSLGYLKNAYSSTYYHHAKNNGLQFIASMEIACDIAYLSIWLIFFTLTTTDININLMFSIMFAISAIAALGISQITPDTKRIVTR